MASLRLVCSAQRTPRAKNPQAKQKQSARPRPAPPTTPQPHGRSAAQAPTASPTIDLSYSSGWSTPHLHASVAGGDWHTQGLTPVVSGARRWHHVRLETPAAVEELEKPLVEFVMTDGVSGWDKPAAGGHYVIQAPGRYCLQHGAVQCTSHTRRLLLVTDLDETLIGEDEATAAFRDWWVAQAVPTGARLVYNTGRSLELFLDLLASKRGLLLEPDLLISAVGTRVYAKHAPTGTWKLEEAFAARLDRGWDLEAVRDAAYAALARAGREVMHFRPPAEQNEHKVTCGVHTSVLPAVSADISARLGKLGVSARVISSGVGDWRFLDLVPMGAGKRQAMEFAAETLGFGPEDVVAAGDSGNDVDMLEGAANAIVVANAQPDLRAWVESAASPGVIVTRATRAWGILEGLEQLGCSMDPVRQ